MKYINGKRIVIVSISKAIKGITIVQLYEHLGDNTQIRMHGFHYAGT